MVDQLVTIIHTKLYSLPHLFIKAYHGLTIIVYDSLINLFWRSNFFFLMKNYETFYHVYVFAIFIEFFESLEQNKNIQ